MPGFDEEISRIIEENNLEDRRFSELDNQEKFDILYDFLKGLANNNELERIADVVKSPEHERGLENSLILQGEGLQESFRLTMNDRGSFTVSAEKNGERAKESIGKLFEEAPVMSNVNAQQNYRPHSAIGVREMFKNIYKSALSGLVAIERGLRIPREKSSFPITREKIETRMQQERESERNNNIQNVTSVAYSLDDKILKAIRSIRGTLEQGNHISTLENKISSFENQQAKKIRESIDSKKGKGSGRRM